MEDDMRYKAPLALLAMVVASPAFADFYVVQEPTTKKCKVVETVPTDKTWVQIGPMSFRLGTRPTSRSPSSAKKSTNNRQAMLP